MANYTAGSVSAEIKLDTTKFKEAIEQLKGEVKTLSETFNSVKGKDSLTQEVEKLKKEMESLKSVNEDYRKQLKKSRDENKKLAEQAKNVSNSINSYQKNLTALASTLKQYNKDNNRFVEETDKAIAALEKQAMANEEAKKSFESANKGLRIYQNQLKSLAEDIKAWGAPRADLTSAISESTLSKMEGAIEILEKLKSDAAILNKEFSYMGDNFKVPIEAADTFRNVFTGFVEYSKECFDDYLNKNPLGGVFAGLKEEQWSFFEAATKGWNDYQTRLSKIADSLKVKWHALTEELAKANAAQYKYWKQIRGSANVEGYNQLSPLQFSYSSYIAEISKIQEAVSKLNFENMNMAGFKEQLIQLAEALKTTGAEMNRFEEQSERLINSMSRMARVNEVSAEITRLSQSISHFSSLSNTNSKALTKFAERVKILKDRLRVLETEFMNGEMAEEIYAAETEKVATQIQKLKAEVTTLIRELNLENIAIGKNGEILNKNSAEYKKVETNARQAGRGITSFNNGIVQTAHSGRILSNTLYQIRGALLSLKMIATAMGGMAIWGFAMGIAEGVKQTFTAKNELEAQLKANAKVGESGLNTFNRALDKTISKFKKINKYALGETVSSIGLEFELTSKQMEKAMPIVAMIQSEYVRAGRTSEEAALAVKDILQGEFQRLSRETGVGKEELLAYGWSGDKTDIDSLLTALDKAAKDRNWDLFAAKATSFNDVIAITKSRFEELGADFLQSISPMIVGGFNALVGAIESLQNAFNGLGSFGKNFVVGGGFIGGITAITTLLPMVTKGMGLAEIATLGWGKSLGTAVFNLNKSEVALYGFRKALAAVITGTNANELATVRTTKAIMGRILGVNQATLAEHGYLTALVKSRLEMTTIGPVMSDASIASMKWYQKLGLLSGGLKEGEAATAGLGKSLLKTATSVKVLRMAFMSLFAIGIIAWFASVATWADAVKKNIDGFNEVVDNGDSMYQDAVKTADNYRNALNNLTEGTTEYNKALNNLIQAERNVNDIQKANTLAKQFKEQNDELEKSINFRRQHRLTDTYMLAGKDMTAASELASGWTEKVRNGQQNIIDSMVIYDHRLYQASQHMNEHVGFMKEANMSEEQMIKYIDEYSAKSEEVADNWKKFNQGDLTSGLYAALGEIQLMWIDLWNDTHFLAFWESVKKTWKDLAPMINQMGKAIGDLGHTLMDFFATDTGRWVGTIGLVIGSVALLGYKFKGTIGTIVDFGKSIVDRIKDLKNFKTTADETLPEIEGGKNTPTTGGTIPDTKDWKKGEFWKTVGNDAKNIARQYAKAAVHIAGAMILISEAIILLQAPMGALAATGWVFEQLEPNIRKGIKGLQLIAPVMAIFLPPVIALMVVMEKYGKTVQWNTMGDAFLKSAVGIAMAITLVTEAILLLNMPMIAMGTLGSIYGTIEKNVQQGIKAMDTINQGLMALVPWVPVFIAGIALAAITFGSGGFGGIAIVAVAAGIAIGIGLVTEAIFLLNEPLIAIAALGTVAVNLPNVEKGVETMKQTAEAMTALATALGAMVIVDWALIQHSIDSIVMNAAGIDLSSLTEEGGFFTQLQTFITDFNEKVTIDPIDPTKAENLKSAATGLASVGEALKAVQTAMDNLPNEFKNSSNKSTNDKYQEAVSGATTDVEGFFDQFKEPIKQLKTFIDDFNKSEDFAIEPPNTERLTAIQQAASMVGEIKTAVDNVKTAMQGIGDAGWAANMAQGGIGAALSGWFSGLGGSTGGNGGGAGSYSSSLGSSFEEMENVISDLVTFNNNVSDITASSEGGDTSTATALANMVVVVDQAIQGLSDTLTNAVPTIKGNANAIGKALHTGIKEGIGDLSTTVKYVVSTSIDSAKPVAETYGKGLGDKLTQGYKSTLNVAQETGSEILRTLTYLDNKKQDFYDKGYALGDSLSQGYKDGNQMHSPGLMARSTQEELGYIQQYLEEGITNLPQTAFLLAQSLSTQFSNSLSLTNFQLPNLSEFQMGLNQVSAMANNTQVQVSTSFDNMKTKVGSALSTTATNATSKYQQMVNTTRTSMANMQSQTTKNIGGIKTSWKGMQTALIASAEAIRQQTSQKISKLQSNMGSFWNKIKNPELLIQGSAGGRHVGTIRRRSSPRRGYAGGSGTVSQSQGLFKHVKSTEAPDDNILEYIKCVLETGKPCYAGWNFNWTSKIGKKVGNWNTHFAKYHLDDFLNVGKFENSNFPVKGRADVAKQYIFDVISGTSYAKYFDSNFGDDPVAALLAGAFNCWDGTNVVLALARAFGFSGSRMHGTWNGVGHVWASIPGLGIIDPTAIQQRGSFTAPGAVNYGGGSKKPLSAKDLNTGTTIETLNVNVTLNGNVDNPQETGEEIGRVASKTILDILKRSDATGM